MQHIWAIARVSMITCEQVNKWWGIGIRIVLSMGDNAWMNIKDGACFPLLPAMDLCFPNLHISWLPANTCGTSKSWAKCSGQHPCCCRDEIQRWSPSIAEISNCDSNVQQIMGIIICLFFVYYLCYWWESLLLRILKDLN